MFQHWASKCYWLSMSCARKVWAQNEMNMLFMCRSYRKINGQLRLLDTCLINWALGHRRPRAGLWGVSPNVTSPNVNSQMSFRRMSIRRLSIHRNVISPNVNSPTHCHFAECQFVECHFTEWQHQFPLFLATPFDVYKYTNDNTVDQTANSALQR